MPGSAPAAKGHPNRSHRWMESRSVAADTPPQGTLRIVGWDFWQGSAVRRILRDRKPDSKRRVTLPFLAVASSLSDPPDPDRLARQGSFEAFAALVGGRAAETLWLRVLQYVAEHDPVGGTLQGVDRGRVGDLVLSRAWDRVHPRVGVRTWDALVAAGLATISPLDFRSDSAGNPPGIRSTRLRLRLRSDLDPVVHDRSLPEATAGLQPQGPEVGISDTASPPPPCALCDQDGAVLDSPTPRCCACTRGRERALRLKLGAQADREQAARAARARAERGNPFLEEDPL